MTKQNTDSRFVDNQRKNRLCSLDSTKPPTVVLGNCRKNTKKVTSRYQLILRKLPSFETMPHSNTQSEYGAQKKSPTDTCIRFIVNQRKSRTVSC